MNDKETGKVGLGEIETHVRKSLCVNVESYLIGR